VNTVKVTVTNVSIEHVVRVQDFSKWVHREGGTPRGRADRSRIREVLGLERQMQ
jgi:hypothetical protein